MQGAIESLTIGTEERRLYLGNVQLARKLSIGSSWTKIRFGSRVAFDTTAWVTNSLTYDLASRICYGMMSNPTANMSNGPYTDTTSHFVGWMGTNSGNSYTQAASGGGANYRSTSSASSYGKKVGTTLTVTAGFSDSPLFSASPSTRRSILMVDMERSGGNVVVTLIALDSGTLIGDTTYASLVAAMNVASVANILTYLNATYGANQYSSQAGTVAVNEGVDGPLNAFCIAWGFSTPAFHVSEVLWRKVS